MYALLYTINISAMLQKRSGEQQGTVALEEFRNQQSKLIRRITRHTQRSLSPNNRGLGTMPKAQPTRQNCTNKNSSINKPSTPEIAVKTQTTPEENPRSELK